MNKRRAHGAAILLGALALFAGPGAARAQQPAPLDAAALRGDGKLAITADEVIYETGGRIARARGHAEAHYGGRVVLADEIIYDQAAGTVTARGDVALRGEERGALFADEAVLDAQALNGVVINPRAALAGGGRFAAVEARRTDGRYNAMSKAVFSPCELCAETGEPLWSIRARRIGHDEQEKFIEYQDAGFLVYGKQVAWLPYFRHPDPTVKRLSGALTPEISRGAYGFGAKLPVFLALGPDRDLTLTPFMTQDDGPLMIARYRAATPRGGYDVEASAAFNDVTGASRLRAALKGTGAFALTADRSWGFDLDLASDDTYLRRYEFSNDDRKTSALWMRKETDLTFAEGNIIYFQSFRADEAVSDVPAALPELRLRSRIMEDQSWGLATLTAGALNLMRPGGRDTARLSFGVEWERPFLLDNGVLATPFATARADLYAVANDAASSDPDRTAARGLGAVGVDLRWPLLRADRFGEHSLEPIAQLVLAPYGGGGDAPNEDGIDTEFDETSLFRGASRFPGRDKWEDGPRANLGVRYEFNGFDGETFEAAYGRVFRLRENDAFSASSGLRGVSSDHVAAFRLRLPIGFEIANRIRFDSGDLSIKRNEIYGSASYGPVSMSGSYVFLAADPASGASEDRSELHLRGSMRLNKYWSAQANARRDFHAERFVSVGGGLRYEDECLNVDLSVDNRFNTDRDAEKGLSVSLSATLMNFGK